MEAPPHYMPPVKKKNTGLIVGIIIGAVVVCCIGPIAALGFLGVWGFNKVMPVFRCGATAAVARDAILGYAKDHDGKLPNAATWQNDIQKYYDREMVTDSPFKPAASGTVWICDDQAKTGLAYNSAIAGKDEKDLSRDDVVLFEVQSAVANASQKYSEDYEIPGLNFVGERRGPMLIWRDGAAGFYEKKSGKFVPVDATAGRSRR